MLDKCCAAFVPFSIFTLCMSEIYLQLFFYVQMQKELKLKFQLFMAES